MSRKYKHSNEEVRKWAVKYTLSLKSLVTLEKEIGISHSTLWWCFTHRLQDIDKDLHQLAKAKLFKNNTSNK